MTSLLKELRSVRLFGLAAFDTVGTFVLAWWLSQRLQIKPTIGIPAVFLAGELVHIGLEIPTPVTNKILQLDTKIE